MAKKRGRPRRGIGEFLRTKMWFHHAAETSQKSAYKLEREFNPHTVKRTESRTVQLSDRWKRYKAGTHTPNPALVLEVSQRYPGTDSEFHSDIWSLTNFEPIEPAKLVALIERRSPELLTELRARVEGNGERTVVGFPQYIGALFRSGTIDDLVALIAAKRYLVRQTGEGVWCITDAEMDEELQAPIFMLLALHLGLKPLRYVAEDLYDSLSDVLNLPDNSSEPHEYGVCFLETLQSVHHALDLAYSASIINKARRSRFFYGLWLTNRLDINGYRGSTSMTDAQLLSDLRLAQEEMRTKLKSPERMFSMLQLRRMREYGVFMPVNGNPPSH